jgi:hypothetical protein
MTGDEFDDLTQRDLLSWRDGAIAAIAEELTLADAYRDAKCALSGDCKECGSPHDLRCVGELHVDGCAVEAAKLEWGAAQDKRRAL